ncbi:septum formation initiator family protein [Myxococcota bacterium]|jgi:cell division protein FtsB|nr:septum formation initiator family protein [Myxococcota bacterium]
MSFTHWKRWLQSAAVVGALVAAVYGFYRLTLDPELVARNQSLSEELSRLEARNRRLETDNAALESEIARLRSEDAESVHHARTSLGMVRPGEVVYQFPAPSPVEPPAGRTP